MSGMRGVQINFHKIKTKMLFANMSTTITVTKVKAM